MGPDHAATPLTFRPLMACPVLLVDMAPAGGAAAALALPSYTRRPGRHVLNLLLDAMLLLRESTRVWGTNPKQITGPCQSCLLSFTHTAVEECYEECGQGSDQRRQVADVGELHESRSP